MQPIPALMLAVWGFSLGLTLYGTYLALRSALAPAPEALLLLFPPISILKPLKGADPGLYENLESFFKLDYPHYELIFSVADEQDPCIGIVRQLIAHFPDLPAKLITGASNLGLNPKVNNLARSYELAQHDWILISDSNVRVKSNYLRQKIVHLNESVGVVTSVVVGDEPSTIGGELESIFLNTFYARGVYLAFAAGKPCVIGKSMLLRKSEAERFGGMRILALYLAEDFMTGEAMRKLGLKIVLSQEPIRQYIGAYSFQTFWSRHLRWGRLRKAQAPLLFALEPFLSCVGSLILGVIAASMLFNIPWLLMGALHLVFWISCDSLLLRRLKVPLTWKSLITWFAREGIALPLWIHIACGKTVQWRGRCLTVEGGGLLRSP